MNQHESAYLHERLKGLGWQPAGREGEADITIVNTCIVTQRAAYQSRQAIRKAIRENPAGSTAAVGCYAQVFSEDLLEIEGIGFIAGNTEKARLPDILNHGMESCEPRVLQGGFSKGGGFDFLPVTEFPGRTRAFLKIQDGCESFCSYCIVPFARGHLRSLDPGLVIKSLISLAENGHREVVLTGVHLGKYGVDLEKGIGLKEMLRMIGKEGLPLRIRLSSLEPKDIDWDLIELMASEDWICRHFHIPLQSGDDSILKGMNRRYTSKEFARLIERIHMMIPLVALGADVMAGFPGEDDKAFNNTFSLIRDLPVSYLHVFPFSPRKGTAASSLPGRVNQDLIKERAGDLRELGKRKREAFYRSCLGREFSVIPEGWHSKGGSMVKGLSDNYLPLVFKSSRLIKDRMQRVRAEELGRGFIIARPITQVS